MNCSLLNHVYWKEYRYLTVYMPFLCMMMIDVVKFMTSIKLSIDGKKFYIALATPVNSTHKGQWRGALKLSLICVWTNAWVNNRDAGDLRRYRAHYDVIVMKWHFLHTMPMEDIAHQDISGWFEVCKLGCGLFATDVGTVTHIITLNSYYYDLWKWRLIQCHQFSSLFGHPNRDILS